MQAIRPSYLLPTIAALSPAAIGAGRSLYRKRGIAYIPSSSSSSSPTGTRTRPSTVHHQRVSTRTFSSSSAIMSSSSSTEVRFSAGADEGTLMPLVKKLLGDGDEGGGGGRWRLVSDGQGLERSIKFKNFAKTWDFMTSVALQCKLRNHHPEWSNVYNVVYIRWTTHNPRGLSAKDVELASICDGLAADFGEVVPPEKEEKEKEAATAPSCEMRGLADSVVAGAGTECCVPAAAAKSK